MEAQNLLSVESARAGYEIQVPNKTEKGDKQNKNVVPAFAYIVHAANDQRYRGKKLDDAKRRKQNHHRNAEGINGLCKAAEACAEQYEQGDHDERVAQNAPPKFRARGAPSVIEAPRPKQLKTFRNIHKLIICSQQFFIP